MSRLALAGALVLLFSALAFQAWTLGPTVDEPSHLISSYLWWHGRDRLYPRDMPPLIKIVGGWPGAIMGLPVPPDLGHPGDPRSEWDEGASLLSRLPAERLGGVLFWSRLPLIMFPLLVTALLWIWGRQLFDPNTAIGIALLWALCPTALGHGALLKNDIAATFMYLLFWYTAWRFWRNPALKTALLFSVAAGFLCLSKLSMLFLIPALPLILIAGVLRGRPRLRREAALYPLLGLATVYVVAAAGWQFEMYRVTGSDLAQLTSDTSVPRWFVASARMFQVIPIPIGAWTGVLSLLKSDASAVPVYMLGQVYPEGNHLYFTLSTVLKMAFPAFLLAIAGTALILFRRKLVSADFFWIAPGFLYFTLASFSSLHLGVRLVLPAWAFFFLLAGAAIRFLLHTRPGRIALLASFSVSVTLAISSYPYGIAFFNPFVGGPQQAIRYLADSNIDWGQSLSEVGEFVKKNNIDRIHVSYFGFDNPARYFRPGQYIALQPPWSGKTDTERLNPGKGWYAISASLLPGHFFQPRLRDYYIEFLRRRPTAVVGGSMFLYRID